MSPMELRAARRTLGLSSDGLGEMLRLGRNGGRTVRRWEAGEIPVSGPATLAIEAFLSGWRPKSNAQPAVVP